MEKNVIVLEKSTNTHTLRGEKVEVIKEMKKMNTMVLRLENAAIIEHGEHATVRTEDDTKNIVKITQQEFNPLKKELMNAFD